MALAERGDHELLTKWLPIFAAFEAGAWFLFPAERRLYIPTLPELVRSDEQHRLHCADGPAFSWQGHRQYYWHGVPVPGRLIVQPETITVAEIDSQKDSAMRQVLRERYGEARYIEATGAEVIDESELGTLYRRTFLDVES